MPKAEFPSYPQKNIIKVTEPLNKTGRLFFGHALLLNGKVYQMYRTLEFAKRAEVNLNSVTSDKPYKANETETTKEEYYEMVNGDIMRHDSDTSYDSKGIAGDGLYEVKM